MTFKNPCAVLWVTTAFSAGLGAQELAVDSTHSPVEITESGPQFRQFDRVEITGSSIIRKEQTQALPVQIITQQDLQRRGHKTLLDAIKGLTQVFNGRDLANVGMGGYTNAALHGMQTGTLVLLNGKRLAPFGIQVNSGQENNGVDLDFLPLTAIDRIELLTDGASSIYGTDAIAGVINIITRTETQGLEISADRVYPQGSDGQGWIAGMTWGQGLLKRDGYSFRVTAEVNQFDGVSVADRRFAGPGRKFFEHNGQSYWVDSALVSSYTSPAWLYSPNTARKAWSALYQNGECTGIGVPYNNVSGTDVSGTCRVNLQPTLDIYPALSAQKWHAQAEIQLPNTATFYAELLRSQSENEMGVTLWPLLSGRVQNVAGAPGYAEMRSLGMNPAAGFYYWRPDLPALRQRHANSQSRAVLGVKGDLADWDYNVSAYQAQSTSVRTYESAQYAELGLVSGPLTNAWLLQPLDDKNPLTAQLLNSRKWQQQVEGKVSLSALDFRGSRALFELNGKDVLLGIGGDVKQEKADTEYSVAFFSPPSFVAKRQSQALFGEIQIPATTDWDVIAALRSDRYSDVGSTTNGKLASRWAINAHWALRGAVGTGFRVPSAGQTLVFVDDYAQYALLGVPCNEALNAVAASLQPTAGSQKVMCRPNAPMRMFTNGNPDLKPEKSQQSTLGLAFSPHRNFSVGMDYWRVRMRGTLQYETWEAALADPLKSTGSFRADPALQTQSNGLGNFNDLAMFLQVRNLGETVKEGIDVDVKYRHPGDWGRWLLGLQGTYMLSSKAKMGSDSVWVSDLAAYSGTSAVVVPRWRSKWVLALETASYQWQLNINYTSGYTDKDITARNVTLGAMETISGRKVPGFTTVDAQGAIQLSSRTQLKAGINNVLNTRPPLSFYSVSGAVLGVNSQAVALLGRTLQLGVTHKF